MKCWKVSSDAGSKMSGGHFRFRLHSWYLSTSSGLSLFTSSWDLAALSCALWQAIIVPATITTNKIFNNFIAPPFYDFNQNRMNYLFSGKWYRKVRFASQIKNRLRGTLHIQYYYPMSKEIRIFGVFGLRLNLRYALNYPQNWQVPGDRFLALS